jgi:hypothetical protein
MWVRQVRAGQEINEKGFLPHISKYGGKQYLTTTAIIHFKYKDVDNSHFLREITIACLPNGLLQQRYNPTAQNTIWLVGRNAPTLGEDFRVRLSFSRLKKKVNWRVQKIFYDEVNKICSGSWKN